MCEKTKLTEAELRDRFNSSEDLKGEFANDFEAFLAFSRADAAGRVQISQPKNCQMVTSEQFSADVRLGEVDAELGRLAGLQKSAAENEAGQYEKAEPCEVS